ncbi:choline transporter-like, partial [Kipferlia bialata]
FGYNGYIELDECGVSIGSSESSAGCSDARVSSANNMFYIGCGVGAATIIYLALVLCMCSRINLAIAVLKVSSTAIRAMFRLVFLPIGFIIFATLLGAAALFAGLLAATSTKFDCYE